MRSRNKPSAPRTKLSTELALAIGGRLLALRQARGWSQQKVCQLSSLQSERLSRLENARAAINLGEAVRLAEVFEIALDELILGRPWGEGELTVESLPFEPTLAKLANLASSEDVVALRRILDLVLDGVRARAQEGRA